MTLGRVGRAALAVGALCSALWIAFVLTLDVWYEMFPRVLIGGIKILFGLWLLVGVILLLLATTTTALRYLRRLL
jgi:hypothetical protein